MANKNIDSSPTQVIPPQNQQNFQSANEEEPEQHHGDTCSIPPAQSGKIDSRTRCGNTVFKSGHLSISSKGIGWTSWKKRWFILTRTSLVFFRSDPSAAQQKGVEANLTLGGIDLNNSGSVVVKADKKLLTVLFPDGRDGRAFTLKADTMEDLYEWKAALETALTQAPTASHVMGQNGIFRNDQADTGVGVDEKKDETPTKLSVLGRPVLLALEDVDGAPSFLEKALRFVEDHGVRIEGILRQAADVDDVEHRIREYEKGKSEFTPEEDAHVIGDCLKYFLRELPSSPVPASCCNALLEACRTDRGNRVDAMRAAIYESFPEPNRRLLQRILTMMQTVASNKNVNRMNTNAVAACMAPLLLRPLLAGDCEIEHDFDVGGDGSMQLLQAAAAANHAQAIVITLLEEYSSIFGEGSLSPGLYSGSGESGSGTEEGSDDYEDYDSQGSDEYTDEEDNLENETNGSYCHSAASDEYADSIDPDDHKINDNLSQGPTTPKGSKEPKKHLSGPRRSSLSRRNDEEKNDNIVVEGDNNTKGKNLSNQSINFSAEVDKDKDNADIERLESTKLELQNRITEEVKNNAVLHASLERRKKDLYGRRKALEQDVERLEEQLRQERDKKSALEAGLKMSKGNQPIPLTIDEKLNKDLQDVAQAETDIANLEHKVDDLETRLGQKTGKASASTQGSNKDSRKTPEHSAKMMEKQKDTEASSTRTLERPKLKDGQGDIEKEQDSWSKSSQQEMSRGSSKSAGMSKKSSTKGEGSITTIAALSKLTMRLNFLKERRSQIANELQNMDKGKGPRESNPSSGQNHVSEETEKGSGSKHDSESSKLQNKHVIDRGRSENGGGDRGKGSSGGSHPTNTSRTFSR